MTNVQILAALLIALVVVCLPAQAQLNYCGTVVTRDFRGRGVLRVDYVLDRAPNGSQGSMHFQVSCPGGLSKSDRDLVLELSINYGSNRRQQSVAYRLPIQLAQGTTAIGTEIPFYFASDHSIGKVRVLEEGRDIEDKRSGLNPGRGIWTGYFNLSGSSTALNNVGAILPTQPGFNTFDPPLDILLHQVGRQTVTFSPLEQPSFATYANILANSDWSKRARLASLASEDWRYYYSGDQWLIPLESLVEMRTSRPAALEALRQFVASGGSILVWSVDHEKAIQEVDRWLDKTEHAAKDFKPTDFGWKFDKPSQGDGDGSIPSIERWQNYRIYHKRFLLGNVWAANDVYSLFSGSAINLAPSGGGQHLVSGSTKVNPANDGAWFWRNLIRSVGKPPIWTFCAFVALFGIMLGPGLLLLTTRIGRRSLMIFFVPALSAIATLLIVLYGVFYEGFATSIRISGVVAVDGRSGEAFAWTRQNYFSGMPPREGLVFRGQTYARPVISDVDNSRRNYPNANELVSNVVDLSGGAQVWRNWLRARQQQQMLIGHSTKSELPISIEPLSGKEVTIKNLTEDVLPIVIARGAKDDYYFAEKLGPRGSVACETQDLDSAAVLAARVRANIRPSSPEELSSSGGSLLNFGRSRRGWMGNSYVNDASPDVINVCYEQYLSEHLDLPPYGFVTVVKSSQAVEIPLKGEVVESSFLVLGTAKW